MDVYHQDLLGLFHPQGKEKHQLKGCLCRFPCLQRSTCSHPTLLLKSTSRLQLLKVQMKYFPVQVEATKQMSPILALRVTWKWIKERKSRILRLDLYNLKRSLRSFERRTRNWKERLLKTNSTRKQCLPIYFLLIASSPMRMLIFIIFIIFIKHETE